MTLLSQAGATPPHSTRLACGGGRAAQHSSGQKQEESVVLACCRPQAIHKQPHAIHPTATHLVELLRQAAHHHGGQQVVAVHAAAPQQRGRKYQPAGAHLRGLPKLQLVECEDRLSVVAAAVGDGRLQGREGGRHAGCQACVGVCMGEGVPCVRYGGGAAWPHSWQGKCITSFYPACLQELHGVLALLLLRGQHNHALLVVLQQLLGGVGGAGHLPGQHAGHRRLIGHKGCHAGVELEGQGAAPGHAHLRQATRQHSSRGERAQQQGGWQNGDVRQGGSRVA
jgi:hypothetical protein